MGEPSTILELYSLILDLLEMKQGIRQAIEAGEFITQGQLTELLAFGTVKLA
jgi:hypothetical protein